MQTKPYADPKGLIPDAHASLLAALPDLQQVAEAHGLSLGIVETLRSQERQRELYAQGRTEPGKIVTWTMKSKHLDGRAVDFGLFRDEMREYVDEKQPLLCRRVYRQIADILAPLGWRWGGDFGDDPHFEYIGQPIKNPRPLPKEKEQATQDEKPMKLRIERPARSSDKITQAEEKVAQGFDAARLIFGTFKALAGLFKRGSGR